MSRGGSKRQSTRSVQTTTINDTTSAIGDNRSVGDNGYIEGNLNLSNVDKVGSIDNSRTTIATDFGALDSAYSVAEDSLKGMQSVSETAIENVVDSQVNALDFADDTVDTAFDFGGKAIDKVADSQVNALDFADETLDSAFEFGEKAIDLTGDNYREMIKANNQANAQVLSATRSDSVETINNLIKYGAYVVGGIAVLFVASKYVGGKR